MWYVYILKCNDSSFYTGISNDIESRIERHNKGKGSKYTRVRRPVELLYAEGFETRSQALSREIEIKNFAIENKRKLVKYGPGKRFSSAKGI